MRRAAALALAGAIGCLGASGAVRAEKADRDMPTQIEANKMSADDARRMTIFEGSVVLTRGTMRLTADRVVVRQDAEGFQFATATGKPARFRQRQDLKPPETEGVWLEGEALRMEIDDRSGKIELYDNAHVKRGGDEVAGNYILLDQRSDYFSVSTGKDVQAAKEGTTAGRVKAVIQPKPRPPEPPAVAPGAPK
jgi:lipopolysaccharide export system protein LptA